MSSRKAATAKNGTKTRAKPAPAAAAPIAPAQATPVAAAAEQLAADIQRALHAGDHEVLSPQTLQKLMTAACRLYSAQSEAGSQVLPVGEVTPTDIMITASGLMRAGNLAVFELGMWQSWTGR
jgi:predicted lipid-binding transport protein (Tim44 family)